MLDSIKISYKNKSKYVPQSWWKLSRKQFLKIHKIFNNRIILEEQTILILKEILNIKTKLFYKLTSDQLFDLVTLTKFVYDKEIPSITNNPLTHFWLKGKRFIGPDAALEKMTSDEYARLDVAIYNYINTQKLEHLYQLASILYRPVSIKRFIKNIFVEEELDIRQPVTDKSIDKRTKFFKKNLPHYIANAIEFIYISIQDGLYKDFPIVFDKAKDKSDEETARNDYGWSGVIINMAGPKFGTINQTLKQPINDILVVLQYELEKQKEQEFNARFKN